MIKQWPGVIGVVMLTGVASACSFTGPYEAEPASDRQNVTQAADVVARDFVAALRLIDGLAPSRTTLQFERASDLQNPFISALRSQLSSIGYGVQMVNEPVGNHLVRHRVSRSVSSDGGSADRYEMSVGEVRLRRDYSRDDAGNVVPATALLVKDAAEPAPISTAPASGFVASAKAESAGSMLPGEAADEVQSPGLQSGDGGAAIASMAVPPGMKNVVELGQSNYKPITDGLSDVASEIIVFEKGSHRLGDDNVALVQAFLNQFDSGSDVVSVVGCAFGPGSGNDELALSRAAHVKQALVMAGAPGGRVLAEGCWGDSIETDKFPKRGAWMKLLRERAQGPVSP